MTSGRIYSPEKCVIVKNSYLEDILNIQNEIKTEIPPLAKTKQNGFGNLNKIVLQKNNNENYQAHFSSSCD